MAWAKAGNIRGPGWVEVDQTASGAITIDFAAGNVQQVTLSAAATSCQIINAVKGGVLVLRILPSNFASSWVWPSNIVWAAGGVAPFVPNSYATSVTFTYDGTNWREISRTLFDSGWANVTYQMAGVGTAAGQSPVAYRRVGNRVSLRGMLAGNQAMVLNSTPFFYLPAGFNPGDGDAHFVVATSGNPPVGYLYVSHSNGAVVPVSGITTAGAWWAMRFTFDL